MADLEELSEGIVLDMFTESANDHEGEYTQLAEQTDFDKF